ncbi:IST1 homolog [Rhopilema esculentum]|uniref:IST1 homolog n=1 Tax=Rhopilema esculentum TaxID=499914 RepID=UPI0031D5D3F6|eukprot:gene13537-4422_t
MFSSGFKSQRLRVNLKLAINRLKMLEKKKTEIAMKSRKEIADFIQANKFDRARIRVEHIIREDYLVEALELVEMYCDLLLARFGLIETMKYCDEGLVEPVSSIIWSAPRLYSDVQELKIIEEQLILKYGKEFGQQARTNINNTVNEKLIIKMSPQAPPKLLVERYLMEIAKNYNVSYEPDPDVMLSEGIPSIDSKEFDNIGSFQGGPGGPSAPGGGSGGHGIGFEHLGNHHGGAGDQFPNIPNVPNVPGNPPYPGGGTYPPSNRGGGYPSSLPPAYNEANPTEKPPYPPNDHSDMAYPPPSASVPAYPPGRPQQPLSSNGPGAASLPDLPAVPSSSPPPGSVGGQSMKGEDVDFDDLARRFEELKKKK